MGHSIGVPGEEELTGTLGCVLSNILPGLFGLTAYHVISKGDKPIEMGSSQPVQVFAPAECDLAQKISELDEKIGQFWQEIREINSSKTKRIRLSR